MMCTMLKHLTQQMIGNQKKNMFIYIDIDIDLANHWIESEGLQLEANNYEVFWRKFSQEYVYLGSSNRHGNKNNI